MRPRLARRATLAVVAAAVAQALTGAAPAQAGGTFTVSGTFGSSAWIIDGSEDPTLQVQRGGTYTFDFTFAPTFHPFSFTLADAPFGPGPHYTDGVSGSFPVTTASSFTWTVPQDAPDAVYYQCENHDAMFGTIQVADPPLAPIFASGFENGLAGWTTP